jgi:copper resistance protein C
MTMSHPFRFAFVLCTALMMPVVAAAHAFLDHADPPVGKTVTAVPTSVQLHFSQKLEAAFSHIEVLDDQGRRVDRNDSHVDASDPNLLAVSLQPLQPGTYKVVWRAVSVDTHVTEGQHVFRVAAP